MARLRDAYLHEVPERLRSLRRDAERIGERDEEAFESFRRTLHRLAGSAAIFGLPELSEAARELELRLDGSPPLSEALRVGVLKDIARLEAAVSAARD